MTVPPGDRRSSRRSVARRDRNPRWVPVTAAAGAILIIIGLVLYFGGDDPGPQTRVGQSAGTAGGPPGGPGGGPGATGPPTPAPAPTAASGCVTARTIAAGSSQQSVRVGADTRTYQLAVPAVDAHARALPLVLAFHAFGEDPAALERYAHLAEIGTTTGYVVVTPNGANGRWNFPRRASIGPDDVAFVAAIIGDLGTRMCLDTRRVFATGLADGADMAITAACALPGTFAAVVPVAFAVLPASCPGPVPSLLAINGTSDPVTPLEGGGADRPAPFDGTQAQPMQARLDRYAGSVGCGPANTWVRDTTALRRLVFTSCPRGRDVGLLASVGGGHVWPDPDADPPKGAARAQFSATEVALAFFRGHPGPAPATPAPSVAGSSPR
ncbi:PHB depolymerase family esterase [Frankia sp. Cas3]|uniref:alpha/beta hydrolase family esterase n=1 Tax=Frankia sp. Cas3 TaxID=3073926 RepID=UPI002AD49FD7|nr:PHB depolymerase family esterase [Frankia sp. Cas3]